MNIPENDTIASIASPIGTGAIIIVRMSGPSAAEILSRIFKGKSPMPSHTMLYGHIEDTEGNILDEVMCCCMYGPKSYTKEDIAEIYCHGGHAVVLRLMDLLIKCGARLAEPGEFTKRAFINGRIDLSQAEAVMELISAKSDMARRAVLRKLHGGLSRRINNFRDRLLGLIANIELSIDYPEHEEEAKNLELIYDEGLNLHVEVENLLKTKTIGDRIKSGIPTVIAGRPNVGKSSLLNAVLQEDRAIVSSISGTTRDTLTETLSLKGIPISLTDTAGIREAAGELEQLGIERTKESIDTAELTLFVIDASVPLRQEDYAVADLLRGRPKIIVYNKCDLAKTGLAGEINTDGSPFVEISAKTGAGLDSLYKIIEDMFFEGGLSGDEDIITSAGHAHLLTETSNHLSNSLEAIKEGMPEDLISIDLRAAYALLGEVIGEAVGDDILDRIFKEFCVGK